MEALRKIRTNFPDLDRVQDAVDEVLEPLLTSRIVDGRLIKAVTLTTGEDNTLNHKLGRTPEGLIPMLPNVECNVWVTEKGPNTLTVKTSATVTLNLWVF